MSEPRPKKQRSLVDDARVDASSARDVANDIFQQILHSTKVGRGGAQEEDSSSESFCQAFSNSRHVTEVLHELQKKISTQLQEERNKRKKLQQQYSRLNQLDKPLQILILNMLDEEGLLTLEESTVFDLGDQQKELLENQWDFLHGMRKRSGYPDRWVDSGLNKRQKGIEFGQASRFARFIEEEAKQHKYGQLEAGVKGDPNDLWPKDFLLLPTTLNDKLFVRVSLKEGDKVHLWEGFSFDVTNTGEKDLDGVYRGERCNGILMKFPDFPKESTIGKRIAAYRRGVNAYHPRDPWDSEDSEDSDDGDDLPPVSDEELDLAESLCKDLTVTVVAIDSSMDGNLKLLVSTGGFYRADEKGMVLNPKKHYDQYHEYSEEDMEDFRKGKRVLDDEWYYEHTTVRISPNFDMWVTSIAHNHPDLPTNGMSIWR